MAEQTTAPASLRIDKWLWCARFFKSRSQATDAVNGEARRARMRLAAPAPDGRPDKHERRALRDLRRKE